MCRRRPYGQGCLGLILLADQCLKDLVVYEPESEVDTGVEGLCTVDGEPTGFVTRYTTQRPQDLTQLRLLVLYEYFPGGTRDELGQEIGLLNLPLPQNGHIIPPTTSGWSTEWDWPYFSQKTHCRTVAIVFSLQTSHDKRQISSSYTFLLWLGHYAGRLSRADYDQSRPDLCYLHLY